MTQYLGPYELRGELGRGAMATVWRAFDPELEREVAIKEPVIPHGASADVSAELAERFVREGKAAARLNHPGIVTIYTAGVFDGRPAIVMELIEGENLGALLSSGLLTPAAALGIVDQLLDAVAYAHEHGVVHRDIKPDNIFITHDGRVKLTDFGIAHSIGGATPTQAGTVMGTPGYMAPEQILGPTIDGRADIFAIGAIAYQLLAGRDPFGVDEGSPPTTVMYRIVHEMPADLPALPIPGDDTVRGRGQPGARKGSGRSTPDRAGVSRGVGGGACAGWRRGADRGRLIARVEERGHHRRPPPAAGLSAWMPYAALAAVAVVLAVVFWPKTGGTGVAAQTPGASAANATAAVAPSPAPAPDKPRDSAPSAAPVRLGSKQAVAGGTKVTVSPAGGTITLPSGWAQTLSERSSSTYSFKAQGPSGAYVRVDTQLVPPGYLEDQVSEMRTVAAGTKKRSYREIRLEPTTFAGRNDAAIWEFENDDADGTRMHKIDTFFQMSERTPTIGIIVGWPTYAPSAARDAAMGVRDSFETP